MNSSVGTSASQFLPPPGTNFIAVIDASLPFLMIAATMGSMLFGMLLALLFFSTPSMRRTPIFVLNVLAVTVGIAYAIINIQSLEFPYTPLKSQIVITSGALNTVAPLLVDCILLLRLYAVFPRRTTPRVQWLAIIGIPVLIKIGRLINIIIFLTYYSRIYTSADAGGGEILLTSRLPSIKIEWFLQMFDNVFSSALFLWRVNHQRLFDKNQTVSQKVKHLFWISTSNFVFPVILSVVQITIYMVNADNYLLVLYVEQVNFHFTIITAGKNQIVFATVWAAEGRWEHSHYNTASTTEQLSTGRYPPPNSTGHLCQTADVVVFTSTKTSGSQSVDDVSAGAFEMVRA
ncbi:hypothetical protein BV22DRAFT_1012674 [Leucogyrophana mollusca]|uniref:Uncharacterized protein n=1 Tax=Leucogyrophana mollusca TaxID=85980 RepID=A0ACB8BG30_9AGAM|nr:hypothetical protein BV22DRAFT_1012674 [Leucogyrophana mollusca]